MVSYSQNTIREPRGKSVRLTSRINVHTWKILTWKTVVQLYKRDVHSVQRLFEKVANHNKPFQNFQQLEGSKTLPRLFRASNWPFQEEAKVNVVSAAIASTATNPRSESVRETRVEDQSLHVQLWFLFPSPNPSFLSFYPLALGVTTRQWLKCRPQLLLCSLSEL